MCASYSAPPLLSQYKAEECGCLFGLIWKSFLVLSWSRMVLSRSSKRASLYQKVPVGFSGRRPDAVQIYLKLGSGTELLVFTPYLLQSPAFFLWIGTSLRWELEQVCEHSLGEGLIRGL